MPERTEAQRKKARDYARKRYARLREEKEQNEVWAGHPGNPRATQKAKAASLKQATKVAEKALLPHKRLRDSAAKAATALTVAGNMGPLREVLDQLRETTETMKGAGLQAGCFTWPDGTALTFRNNGEVIITFGDVQ